MAYEYAPGGSIDYAPCRYGRSKLLFRGPRRTLDRPFIAAAGGSETYGKYVAEPWPALLEARLAHPVVNFGLVNAGVDVYLGEPEMAAALQKAEVTVIQLTGAHNISNRYYAVHPRRNDRFLRASQLMRSIYKDVDFTEFNFTRHMLTALRRRCPDRFEVLAEELRGAWVSRMLHLMEKAPGPKILLWIGEHRAQPLCDGLGTDPLLVTAEMVEKLRPEAAGVVRVVPSMAARAAGTAGMQFGPLEGPAAGEMAGPLVHAEIAAALEPALRPFL